MKQCDVWMLHEKFIRFLWEISRKDEWRYCGSESSIKGGKPIYLSRFLSSPSSGLSSPSPFWVASSSPFVIYLKDISMPFHWCFYPRPKVLRDTKDSRFHWSQRTKALWLARSWSFMVILGGILHQRLQETVEPRKSEKVQSIYTCYWNLQEWQIQKAETADMEGKPFIPNIWDHP